MSGKVTVTVKAMFVGYDENGRLIKNAPGSYKAGEIVELPYHEVIDNKWWEALEVPPDLVVPPSSEGDSVFVEQHNPNPLNDPDIKGMEDRVIDVTPVYEPKNPAGMVKQEIVDYIHGLGGEANMGMSRDDLLAKAKEVSKTG